MSICCASSMRTCILSSWACIFRRKSDLILYFKKSTLVVRIIGQLVCYSIFRGYLTNYPLYFILLTDTRYGRPVHSPNQDEQITEVKRI